MLHTPVRISSSKHFIEMLLNSSKQPKINIKRISKVTPHRRLIIKLKIHVSKEQQARIIIRTLCMSHSTFIQACMLSEVAVPECAGTTPGYVKKTQLRLPVAKHPGNHVRSEKHSSSKSRRCTALACAHDILEESAVIGQ